MKGRINARMKESVKGGFGPRLWVLESPVSSSGPQQTRERSGWEGNTLGSGWLADRHLPLTHQPPTTLILSPPLCPIGGNEVGQNARLQRKKGVRRKRWGFQLMMCEG